MTNYVDPNTQTGSTNYANLTNYFNQMSLGAYHVIGDVVYVKTPKNKNEYGSPLRYNATKDVLQNAVDPLVNFADYDNWTFNSSYNHTNQSDGVVDIIVMIWRGLVLSSAYLGEASLGGGGSPFTVEGGTVTIKTGFGGNLGSGFTVQSWGDRSVDYNFHTPVHEHGHWLLGSPHPYPGNLQWEKMFGE